MKIGLLDLDQTNFPNLPLMKLSAYHRGQGNTILFNFPLQEADMTYVACVFAKNRKKLPALKQAVIGGTGFIQADNKHPLILWAHLPHEIEGIMPDYSLYNVEASYGFTSRGCIRRCPWCIVPGKEGRIKPWAPIYQFWDRRHRDIILLDNNLLAAPNWKETLLDLERERLRVDFNQGLDIRLIDKEKAYLLSRLHYMPHGLRFSLDSTKYMTQFREGMGLLKHGINLSVATVYFLIGFDSSLEDDLARLDLIKQYNATPYAMPYQEVNGVKPKLPRNKNEINEFARWVNIKARYHKYFTFEEWLKIRGFQRRLNGGC